VDKALSFSKVHLSSLGGDQPLPQLGLPLKYAIRRQGVGKLCAALQGEGICRAGTEAGPVGGGGSLYKQVR